MGYYLGIQYARKRIYKNGNQTGVEYFESFAAIMPQNHLGFGGGLYHIFLSIRAGREFINRKKEGKTKRKNTQSSKKKNRSRKHANQENVMENINKFYFQQ